MKSINERIDDMFESKKKYICVDLDGTLCDIRHRLKYIEARPKQKYDFHMSCDKDSPIDEVIDIVNMMSRKYTIVFCSGRSDIARDKTIAWLTKYTDIQYKHEHLLLREDGDKRTDDVVKFDMLKNAGIPISQISFVLDDRDMVVKAFRDAGVRVLQVAYGDF